MQEDKIIQKNLFAINNEPPHQKSSTHIPEDFSPEELTKESKNRPRQRKNSKNLINKFKNFIGQLWFSKNSPGNKNELSIRIFGSKGSIEWAHKKHEEIILSDNNGNKHYISRRSKNTKYLKNDKYFINHE